MTVQLNPMTAGATAPTTANPKGDATTAQATAVDLAVQQAGGDPAKIIWTNSITNNSDGSWSYSVANISTSSGLVSLFGVDWPDNTPQYTVKITDVTSPAVAATVTITDAANTVETFHLAGTPTVQTTSGGVISAGTQASAILIGTGPATLRGGSGSDLLIELGNNGTIVGGSGNTQVLVAGTNQQVTTAAGTITATAGSSLNLWGYSNTLVLNGTGDYLGLQGSSGNQVTAVGSTISATSGSSFNLWGYNDTIALTGTSVSLGLQGSTGDQVTAAGDTITATSGSSFNLWGYADTIGLTGTNVYLGLQGSTGDQVTAAGDTINATSGSSFNLWGYNDTIGLTGTNVYLGLQGSSNDQVTAAGDTITATSGSSFNVWGYNDTIGLTGTNEYLGLQGSTGDQVTATGDTIGATTGSSFSLTGNGDSANLNGNIETVTIVGSNDVVNVTGTNDIANLNWGTVNLDGSNDSVTINGTQDVANSIWSGDTVGFNGTNETANLSNGTVNLDGDDENVTINGSGDLAQSIWSGDTIGFNGTNENAVLSNGTVNLDGNGQEATVIGSNDLAGSAWNGNVVGFAGTSDTAQISNGTIYLDNASTTVTVEGNGDTANSQFSGNTVGFTGRGDTAQVSNATIYTDDTSGGLSIVGSGDTTNAISGVTQSTPVLDDQTVSDIDALYNIVLDRDPTSAELIGAQTELATGAGLDGLMSTLAGSAELQADMASTYAAASGPYQSLMTAQPQSNEEQTVTSSAPTQAEFNAFADAMSTSYGAPIEIVSFDPDSGAQTELADTSATNLLAELPVLETQANGVNLGLKLADGTELQFASTARLTTFLYSVAVQQMQATQFVTDNDNLDMQWLNTIDQPLLQEAVFASTPPKNRPPLLIERQYPLPPILRRNHPVICLDLEQHPAPQIRIHPHVHRLLDLPRRNRSIPRNHRRRLQRVGNQHLRGADTVHHAPSLGLLHRERSPGQQDLLRPPRPHRSGQVLRAARAGHDAERDLGQGEAGVVGGVDEVAAERDLHPPGIGRAVDRGDDRHRTGQDRAHHPLEDQMLVLPFPVGHAVALLQVPARAERPRPRTGHDDAALRVRGGAEPVERVEQVEAHLGVHRVRDLRPVQRDQHDVVRRRRQHDGFVALHCSIACMISRMNVSVAVGSVQRSTATMSCDGATQVTFPPAPLAMKLSSGALLYRPRPVFSHHSSP